MTLKNFLLGLEILKAHYSNPEGYHLGAEHDQIYLYATDYPLNSEEYKYLRSLNWFQPNAPIEDLEDEDSALYASEEGWSVHV